MTFEDWRTIIGVILDGAFHCVKACLDAIKKSDAGSIINVGGLTGAMGAPDRVHVVTAKAGIAGFTRGLAMELAPHKITVNTLVPAMLAKPDKPNEIPPHPIYRPLLGRAAWPTDIAPLARFLVGPGARYITGQTHQRQRRDVFRLLRPESRSDDCSEPADLDHRHHGHRGPADHLGLSRPAHPDRGARVHARSSAGTRAGSAISPRPTSSARCSS